MATWARRVQERVCYAAAWNFTPEERSHIKRQSYNQYGVRYDFDDGSVGWVDKGTEDFLLYVGAPQFKG